MNEKQMRALARDCVKEYYEEDKKILIDISVLKIACITFLLYNQVFFGNKVLLTRETWNAILRESKKQIRDKRSEIIINNANYLIQAIEKDERENYQIIELEKGKYEKAQRIWNFLKQNVDTIFYLSDPFLYQHLRDNGLNSQLNYIEMGKREVDPFQYKSFKFETIGAIKFEDGEMLIYPKESPVIKVYNQKGQERTNKVKKVKIRDYVLIVGKKEDGLSFHIYQIVSKHTRNHAIRIIWTDLKNGEKTNKYIDRLPYQYRKMILDNVE